MTRVDSSINDRWQIIGGKGREGGIQRQSNVFVEMRFWRKIIKKNIKLRGAKCRVASARNSVQLGSTMNACFVRARDSNAYLISREIGDILIDPLIMDSFLRRDS